MRGCLDGAGKVEFLGRAGAREFAQAPQCELDGAGAEFDLVVKILELAPVPHLDGALVAARVLADAHALRIIAVSTIRRGPGGADPCAAALVAAFLHGE